MAKNRKQTYKPANKPQQKSEGNTHKSPRKPIFLPVTILFFLLVWAWASLYYGDVFRITREYSFWAPDSTLMRFELIRPWGTLWTIGMALLQLFRWPLLGGAVLSLFLTKCSWMLGYCMRLRGWWRLIQFVPACAYIGWISYLGFDLYFESETGMLMGIPFLALLVLLILTLIIRSFSRHPLPSILRPYFDETPLQNKVQALLVVLMLGAAIGFSEWQRPYVRVVTTMQCQMMEQDWAGMEETARAKADLSYRQIAAYYVIALTQRGEQGNRLFDIRLDYDVPHMSGFDGTGNNASNYYIMDCDFYSGLIETSIHHTMEQMTMNGTNLRALKLLTKCALMRNEWEVADKYLHILSKAPFEGDWVAKYKAMVNHPELVNEDPEFKMIRLTEPMHDSFENTYVQPVFLGYNASLVEGRSINALWNSLMVHIYTKTMDPFLYRCQPLRGSTPPNSITEALTLMSSKHPELEKMFQGIEYNKPRLINFLNDVKPYMQDRPGHAQELFPKYKGYYPYYYFFGNLKATKKKKENEGTSNQGVN